MSNDACSECHRPTTRDEEVDDLYARLDRLTAENDRLRAVVDAIGKEFQAENARLRAAISPNEANLEALAERARLPVWGRPFNQQVAAILAAIAERAGRP